MCSKTSSISVVATAVPSISLQQIINVSCFGGTNGEIFINASGGAGLTFLWSNGLTTKDISSISANTYTVTVSNNEGCTTTSSFVVNQSSILNVSTSFTSASCNQSNGSAAVNVSGGSPGYSYLWSNGSTNSTISGLPAGTYIVSVTDSKSCTVSQIVNVTNLTAPVITNINVTNAQCYNSSNGQIVVTIFGGTNPFR